MLLPVIWMEELSPLIFKLTSLSTSENIFIEKCPGALAKGPFFGILELDWLSKLTLYKGAIKKDWAEIYSSRLRAAQEPIHGRHSVTTPRPVQLRKNPTDRNDGQILTKSSYPKSYSLRF